MMAGPVENNDLIDLNSPDDQPQPESHYTDPEQHEETSNPEVVIGSNVIIDPDTVQVKTLGYKWEVDVKNKRDILPGKKFVSGDWFRSPIAHVIAFLIFIVSTWYLVSWLGPYFPGEITNWFDFFSPRGGFGIIYICFMPLMAYVWFLTS
ncbi:MAG: hypothetical protein NTY09_04280 [bacterium]|nr:hypothetical protein [bacterium]